jgi:hypothetical protein
MADDWIKMRGAILTDPKLIALSVHLLGNPNFRAWLSPSGSDSTPGQPVSDGALRRVTAGALLSVWSAAREHGKFDGDDLVLPFITVDALDDMAGCPGIGKGMQKVEWAVKDTPSNGVRLPRFKSYNVPKSNAERQRGYRERQQNPRYSALRKSNRSPVTNPLPEKRREECYGAETTVLKRMGFTGRQIGLFPRSDDTSSHLAHWAELETASGIGNKMGALHTRISEGSQKPLTAQQLVSAVQAGLVVFINGVSVKPGQLKHGSRGVLMDGEVILPTERISDAKIG